MRTIRDAASALRTLLTTVEPLGRETGFVRRRSKVSGVRFVQTLVCGWLADPDIPPEGLCPVAASPGVRISPQGLEQRLTTPAAHFPRRVPEQALATRAGVRAEPVLRPVPARFTAVFVSDGTVARLPGALAATWPGRGNAGSPAPSSAALKAAVRLELRRGTRPGPARCPGRTHARAAPEPGPPAEAGAPGVADPGFFSPDRFRALSGRGVFWLSRRQTGTVLDGGGQRHTAETCLPNRTADAYDGPLEAGARHRLPARPVALRVPPPGPRGRPPPRPDGQPPPVGAVRSGSRRPTGCSTGSPDSCAGTCCRSRGPGRRSGST
jgi:hypothetical protein